MSVFGSGRVPLVIDTSAWSRQREPAIAERWMETARADLLVSCPVSALEIMSTARDEDELALLDRTLGGLRQAPVTEGAGRAALAASRALRGRRRLPAADYLIAAAAAERGFGVLHQDRHFDTLAEILGFESVHVG